MTKPRSFASTLDLPAHFTPTWRPPPEGAGTSGRWFVFRDGDLLVVGDSTSPEVPLVEASGALPVDVRSPRLIGYLGETACWAASAAPDPAPNAAPSPAPSEATFEPLRRLFERLPGEQLGVAGRALQVLEFHRTHHYCGVCASETTVADDGRARRCPRCRVAVYPRVAPAMMVLIKRDGPRGRELLLAKHSRTPTTAIYSALAGFVEPSESLEACVQREAFEEVGIRIGNLRYFGSQGWPFPHALMIAFVADYEGGDIVCQKDEIRDARFFGLDELPPLPMRVSIARRLIDATIAEVAPEHPVLS